MKMTKNSFLSFIICHCLLFMSLRLMYEWHNYIDSGKTFSHTFYDSTTWQISLSPDEPYTYKLKWFIAYSSDKLRPLIYLICFLFFNSRLMIGRLNLWYLYIALEISLYLDYYLFFNQFPFRVYLIYTYVILGFISIALETKKYVKGFKKI